MSTWTHFWDMHSGGGQKEDFAHCLIEAPESDATTIFYHRFGHNPNRVTCACCGADYSISEYDSVAEATAYHRELRYAEDARGWLYGKDRPDDYRDGCYLEPGEAVPEGMRLKSTYRTRDSEGVPLDAFLADPTKHGWKIIRADEIGQRERSGDVPQQGYVWVD